MSPLQQLYGLVSTRTIDSSSGVRYLQTLLGLRTCPQLSSPSSLTHASTRHATNLLLKTGAHFPMLHTLHRCKEHVTSHNQSTGRSRSLQFRLFPPPKLSKPQTLLSSLLFLLFSFPLALSRLMMAGFIKRKLAIAAQT